MSKQAKTATQLITNRINEYLDIVHMHYMLPLTEMSCMYHKTAAKNIYVQYCL